MNHMKYYLKQYKETIADAKALPDAYPGVMDDFAESAGKDIFYNRGDLGACLWPMIITVIDEEEGVELDFTVSMKTVPEFTADQRGEARVVE